MRNVLAVVTPHARHEGVIDEAARLLTDGRGRLTVLCLWSPTPYWIFAGYAGIPPIAMLANTAEQSTVWLREGVRPCPGGRQRDAVLSPPARVVVPATDFGVARPRL